MAQCGRRRPQSISELAGNKRVGPFPLPARGAWAHGLTGSCSRPRPGFVPPAPGAPTSLLSVENGGCEEAQDCVHLEAWARSGTLGSAGLVSGVVLSVVQSLRDTLGGATEDSLSVRMAGAWIYGVLRPQTPSPTELGTSALGTPPAPAPPAPPPPWCLESRTPTRDHNAGFPHQPGAVQSALSRKCDCSHVCDVHMVPATPKTSPRKHALPSLLNSGAHITGCTMSSTKK